MLTFFSGMYNINKERSMEGMQNRLRFTGPKREERINAPFFAVRKIF